MEHVRDVLDEAYRNQDIPFDLLVEELRPRRKPFETPLVNVILAMKSERRPVVGGDLTFIPEPMTTDTAKFDLAVLFEKADGQFCGEVEYRRDLIEAPAAGAIGESFARLLGLAEEGPDATVAVLARAAVGERPATPAPSGSAAGDGGADSGPGPAFTGVEETLRQIWRELLGRSDIGRDDDFFALGGHSLPAAHVTVRIRERLGVTVPLSWCLESSTIEGLAIAVLEEQLRAAGGDLEATLAESAGAEADDE
ncbi:hypothetical protein GCM10023191_020610 [Actinoallomurus oryzae]|uniref:Carrier domain-containing protein n=1 Tax=Actinoallomurus oryzae TaxID=502180 RepID=A0ABP8PQC4_9ACTN